MATRVRIRNAAGGRGYDLGIRTFDCPLCGDARARGWISLERWSAGCWNAGCRAEPRLAGGVVEWVALIERKSRREVWHLLLSTYAGAPRPRPRAPVATQDWVIFPREVHWLEAVDPATLRGGRIARFLAQQWGVTWTEALRWRLGVCWHGRYAHRLIIPIAMPHPVAFQARTLAADGEPKYRTSAYGTECGRRGSALLFNLQPALVGVERLLVEGAGDVMAWHRADPDRRPHATGLLGVALTPEKLALLAETQPARVIVALDAEPAAQQRALLHVQDLLAWGFTVDVLGHWVGAKDAGAGAELERRPLDVGPAALVTAILTGGDGT